MKKIFLYLLFIPIISLAQREISNLHKQLLKIPGITVKTIDIDSHFTQAFEIFLEQPVDHLNPINGPKFKQRIYLRHLDENKPMIFNNEGYSTNSRRRTELASILKCNEMFVEHRYFGQSKPDSSVGWKFLTTAQAAADHKRIVDLFKSIYKGKWVSTGISKGGQTTIMFKYYYPNAVDVWVPYVAPLNLEREDKRILQFFKSVGSIDCREKIKAFQRAVLKNKDAIIPLLEKRREEKNYDFIFDLNKIIDLNVLEYSFAFWQWGNSKCEDIPDSTALPDKLFKHLYTTSSFSYFDKKEREKILPFFYQAYTELGYYGYETNDFSDLIPYYKNIYISSVFFAPENVELRFNNKLMNNVNQYLQASGNNILYIYGENDPWGATSVKIGNNTNALKMVKEGGSHRTRIRSFEGAQKEKIYSTLEKWLNTKIDRQTE